jgi:hypothetical protein
MEDIIQAVESLKKSQTELLDKLELEEHNLKVRLSTITGMIADIKGGGTAKRKPATAKVKTGTKKKRTMSPEAKAKIAAAQKKRWAAFHAKKKK